MRIARVEALHCDGGWRPWTFVRLETDDGLVGWGECSDSRSPWGIAGCVRDLADLLIGQDPRPVERLYWDMLRRVRQNLGGVSHKAIAGIELALWDLKAKALGVPVYELFGGPVRNRIRLYWSHCGTYRLAWPEPMQIPPLRTLDDVVAMGKEVVEQGYTALKTNVFILDDHPRLHAPGFARGDHFPELNAERPVLAAIRDQLAAFREGAGPDVDILVDLNFNYKTEGFLKMARAMEPFDLFWVEIDSRDAEALRYIRQGTTIPLASGECLFGRRDYRPYFERQAMDTRSSTCPGTGSPNRSRSPRWPMPTKSTSRRIISTAISAA